MKAFFNREDEASRLLRLLNSGLGGLAVVYGRRRCGKSTLLQRVLPGKHVYWQADQREVALQIEAFALALSKTIPEFHRARYPGWTELFSALYARQPDGLGICMDEFPYLVHNDPSLPAVLQRFVDDPEGKIAWVLCGSSQRMMQGLVLDRRAPLYGRAREILHIHPLAPGYLVPALGLEAMEAVRAYSVWGGVPRYWELAADSKNLDSALEDLVWSAHGVLHEEPTRLLLDDLRSAVQPYSILSLIGSGCHKPSEISARLEKPLSSLARPLALLCELGYVRRDLPFGEHPLKSKRALYRLADPFLQFYFRFVLTHKSELAQRLTSPALRDWKTGREHHFARCWENLCRRSAPWMPEFRGEFGTAQSWWGGAGDAGREIDLVMESADRKTLLVGECKWSGRSKKFDLTALDGLLREKANQLPAAKGKKILTACFLAGTAETTGKIDFLFGPDEVMDALRGPQTPI